LINTWNRSLNGLALVLEPNLKGEPLEVHKTQNKALEVLDHPFP
jgi:hypothetical protein